MQFPNSPQGFLGEDMRGKGFCSEARNPILTGRKGARSTERMVAGLSWGCHVMAHDWQIECDKFGQKAVGLFKSDPKLGLILRFFNDFIEY